MIVILFWLAIYAAIIFVLILILHKAGVARRKVIFASSTLFGILSGLAATLRGLGEGGYIFNFLGVLLGEEIYTFSIGLIGDPHSFFAHYTIPWILRIPQIFLFTSATAWGVIGALAQLIYNQSKKPPATKGHSTRIIILLLVACLAICAAGVYATQKAHAKPLEPVGFPVVEIIGPPTPDGPPPPDWETITTYEVEKLYLSDNTVLIGRALYVTSIVKNTGPKGGIVKVELSLDGGVLSSQEVALLPGESKPIKFVVIVPEEGTYIVGIDGLTTNFEAKKP